jgi:hypothetical protein
VGTRHRLAGGPRPQPPKPRPQPQAQATVGASRPRLKSPTEQPAGPRQHALQGFQICFGPSRRSAPGPTASSPWSRSQIARPRWGCGAAYLVGFGERRLPKFGQGSSDPRKCGMPAEQLDRLEQRR